MRHYNLFTVIISEVIMVMFEKIFTNNHISFSFVCFKKESRKIWRIIKVYV
jgi:hypothetical protein